MKNHRSPHEVLTVKNEDDQHFNNRWLYFDSDMH